MATIRLVPFADRGAPAEHCDRCRFTMRASRRVGTTCGVLFAGWFAACRRDDGSWPFPDEVISRQPTGHRRASGSSSRGVLLFQSSFADLPLAAFRQRSSTCQGFDRVLPRRHRTWVSLRCRTRDFRPGIWSRSTALTDSSPVACPLAVSRHALAGCLPVATRVVSTSRLRFRGPIAFLLVSLDRFPSSGFVPPPGFLLPARGPGCPGHPSVTFELGSTTFILSRDAFAFDVLPEWEVGLSVDPDLLPARGLRAVRTGDVRGGSSNARRLFKSEAKRS